MAPKGFLILSFILWALAALVFPVASASGGNSSPVGIDDRRRTAQVTQRISPESDDLDRSHLDFFSAWPSDLQLHLYRHHHQHQISFVSRWLDSPLGSESVAAEDEKEKKTLEDEKEQKTREDEKEKKTREEDNKKTREEGDNTDHHHHQQKQQHQQHKPLLPLSARDVAGFAAAAAIVALAAGGGIGGGGLLVPLYLLLFGFETRDAVALSNITILGGASISLLFNLPRRHPTHKERSPLIDWDMILIMEPSTICGAVAGALLNKITPTWLTTSLLFLLLAAMTAKLAARSRKVWRLEEEERRLARYAAEQGQERVEGLSALLLENGVGGEEGGGRGAGAPNNGEGEEDGPLLLGSTLSSAPSVPSLASFAGDDDDDDGAAAAPSVSNDGSKPKPSTTSSPSSRGGLFFSRRRASNGGTPSAVNLTSPKPPKPAAAALANGNANGDNDVERQHQPSSSSSPTTTTGEAEAANNSISSSSSPFPFSEPRMAPPAKVAAVAALTLVVAAVDVAKRRVPCGSFAYWAIASAVVPPSLLIALTARNRLVKEHELRSSGAPGWPPCGRGEVRWTRVASLAIPAVSTLAGVVAGFFGVGGGIVKGPLMISMDVAPEVAAATSITMILFTSSAASVVYLSFGVPEDYAAVFFVVGAFFTALGQVAVTRAVKKLGRPSIIVITMAAMMAISAVVVAYEAESLTREAVREGELGKHGHIC